MGLGLGAVLDPVPRDHGPRRAPVGADKDRPKQVLRALVLFDGLEGGATLDLVRVRARARARVRARVRVRMRARARARARARTMKTA